MLDTIKIDHKNYNPNTIYIQSLSYLIIIVTARVLVIVIIVVVPSIHDTLCIQVLLHRRVAIDLVLVIAALTVLVMVAVVSGMHQVLVLVSQ